MDAALTITLQMVIAVIAGISAQVLADYLKVPSIVFLLLLRFITREELRQIPFIKQFF